MAFEKNNGIHKPDLSAMKRNGKQAQRALQHTTEQAQKNMEQMSDKFVQAVVQPVYKNDLEKETYTWPSIIHLEEHKRFMENNILPNNAIGKMCNAGKTKYMELYADKLAGLKVLFYPNNTELIYIKYPYRENLYVSAEEYFKYMKKQLVSELELVANNLGAKHIKVIYSEHKKVNGMFQTNANGNTRKIGVDIAEKKEYEKHAAVDIAADVYFDGSDQPIEPKLQYFKDDLDIQGLIKMRMSGDNQLKSKSYTLTYKNFANMKEALDVATKVLKVGPKVNAIREKQKINEISLQYEIEF